MEVITWLWGTKYSAVDVIKLASRVRRNLKTPHRFHVFADRSYTCFPDFVTSHLITDLNLLDRSCFCRLRMFDPQWQHRHGLTGSIVSLDLDLVITGPLDRIFAGDDDFRILQGVNASNPNPFNASIMQLQAGCRAEVWKDFSPDKASKVPYFSFPDDQGWVWHKLPNAKGWRPGPDYGIYAFKKPGWPGGHQLPADATIVAFIGYRKPEQFGHLPWIQKYWTDAA